MDVDAFIPAALTDLAQKIQATASATYRPRFGVGITHWRVMALLASRPWIAPMQVCESTGLDKAAVSRALRDLAGQGLVESGDGRRRVPVALTAKGLALHDRIVGIAFKRQEHLLQGFSPEERAQLKDFIARMRRQAETIKTSVRRPAGSSRDGPRGFRACACVQPAPQLPTLDGRILTIFFPREVSIVTISC